MRERVPARRRTPELPAAPLHALQRSAGNHAVARWIAALHREADGTPKGSYAGGSWDGGAAKVVPLVSAGEIDDKKATLYEKVMAIKKIVENLGNLATQMQSAADGDEDLIGMAKTVNGIHRSANEIADGFDKLAGTDSQLIAGDAKAVEYFDKAIEAAETLRTLERTQAAADALAAKPSYETASAWADQVGDVFDKAAGYLPVSALPSFMQDYFKGLFGAPKNYIAAFKGLMDQHYKGLDAASGANWWGGPEHHKGASDGGTYVWEGELTGVYRGCAFAGSLVANTLPQYMKAHRTIDGVDLYKVNSVAVGVGLLQSQINGDAALDDATRKAYLAYLGGV